MGECPCGCEPKFVLTPQFKHHGKLVCSRSGTFIKWLANPDKDDRRETTRQKVERSFCAICLRKRSQLGVKESLEIHHIVPLSDGGKDDPLNILVACTACHRLVHWAQLYLNKHLIGGEVDDTPTASK